MVTVFIGNNVKRETKILEGSTTLREAFEMVDIDYTVGTSNLDGVILQPGDIDKTFDELGVKEKCFLKNVVKTDNA